MLPREGFDLNDENVSPHKAGYVYGGIFEFDQQIGPVIGSTALPMYCLDTWNPLEDLLHEGFQPGIRVGMVDLLRYFPQKRMDFLRQASKFDCAVLWLKFESPAEICQKLSEFLFCVYAPVPAPQF